GQLLPLSSSRQTYEMSNAIIKWMRTLYRVRDDICLFFDTELWNATNIFDYERVESDIEQSNSKDFGLLQAIEDPLFLKELLDFTNFDELPIHAFPLLYEFIRSALSEVKQISLSDEELAFKDKIEKEKLVERHNTKQRTSRLLRIYSILYNIFTVLEIIGIIVAIILFFVNKNSYVNDCANRNQSNGSSSNGSHVDCDNEFKIHFALVIAAYAAHRRAKENNAASEHEVSESNVSSAHETSSHRITEKNGKI
ncbi:21610_t:CDS:2, partial [Gigaspora margarita]